MQIIIGRRDKADFPELGLENIDIKIDTGAYTSSIHCHNINVIVVDGVEYVEFQLLDPLNSKYDGQLLRYKYTKKKRVKSSFGATEQRYLIATKIVLFGKEYLLELSLTERSEMKYPVLIGRKLLDKNFIVDTAQYNISFKNKKQITKLTLQDKS